MSSRYKIIFLDIDGVLNVCYPERDQYGSRFHPHFEENLKRLIDKTGAKIVISSSWRSDGLEVMIEMWKYRNLPGEVVGITCSEEHIKKILNKDKVVRGDEIQEFLDTYKDDISNYVILDDDCDMLPEQFDNFVQCSDNQTHEDCIDIGYGLTSLCVDRAIEVLNR